MLNLKCFNNGKKLAIIDLILNFYQNYLPKKKLSDIIGSNYFW